MPISIVHPSQQVEAQIPLVSSKSETNRALIIQALAKAQGVSIELNNLASARDSVTMQRLLSSDEKVLDVLDAGTTMRFLTAYCTVNNRPTVLTGTERMQNRPIGILIDALRTLGAEIVYKGKEGYPPFEICGFTQTTSKLSIRGDVSSQFISALLLVAPTLPKGLSLKLTGEIGSRPYIQMTLDLLSRFGISYEWNNSLIEVKNQPFTSGDYIIESDWSGSSYWFSTMALAKSGELFLPNLKKNSLQGDSAMVEIGRMLGVDSQFTQDGLNLTKGTSVSKFSYDFSHSPDLAQTVAVICAARNIPAELSGLKSLRIKETDRIDALKNELSKFGSTVDVEGDDLIRVLPGDFRVNNQIVETYEDHRMAMAFAPLALSGPLQIKDPAVVDKSYPEFWTHCKLAGFIIKGLN